MTEDFILLAKTKFLPEDIPDALKRLYELDKSKNFLPKDMQWLNYQKIPLDDLDFDKLRPFITESESRGVKGYCFNLNGGGRMEFDYDWGDGAMQQHARWDVSIEDSYFLDEKGKWNDKHLEKWLGEIIDFSIAFAKVANTDFVIGGWEGYEASHKAWNIRLLIIRKGMYKKFLKDHIKFKFGLDVTEEEIKKLVKENAYSVEERDDLMIISFSLIRGYPPGHGSTKFYEAVKNIVEMEKK